MPPSRDRTTAIDPAAMTSVAANAARSGVSRIHRTPDFDADRGGIAIPVGMTPAGTRSSAPTMRDAAATSPRASATSARHSPHVLRCASTRAISSGDRPPSIHA
jgi:hypothetical protein